MRSDVKINRLHWLSNCGPSDVGRLQDPFKGSPRSKLVPLC